VLKAKSVPNPILADLIVVIHFGFILFVIFGGFLVWKYPRMIWLHLPAVIWGASIEFAGWLCPLTTVENRLRSVQGDDYSGGFIEHYLMPAIYPSSLTRGVQIGLGVAVIVINSVIYGRFFAKRNAQDKSK
jgi:hypothetical protein